MAKSLVAKSLARLQFLPRHGISLVSMFGCRKYLLPRFIHKSGAHVSHVAIRIKSAIFLCVRNSGFIYCQEDETMASINMLFFDGSGIVPFTEKKLLFSFSTAADDVSLRLIRDRTGR